jgi:hypothetical protein
MRMLVTVTVVSPLPQPLAAPADDVLAFVESSWEAWVTADLPTPELRLLGTYLTYLELEALLPEPRRGVIAALRDGVDELLTHRVAA